MPSPGIARHERFGLGRKLGRKLIGNRVNHDEPFGGHANLTGIEKRAERRGLHRFVEIRVLEDNQRRLAAEFEQTRLEVLRRPHGDDSAHLRRTGEVDAFDRRVINQCAHHVAGGLRRIRNDTDQAFGQSRGRERLNDDSCVRGQISDALNTTALPQASAVTIARTPRITGAFHGAMPSTTPTGSRSAIAMTAGLVRRNDFT